MLQSVAKSVYEILVGTEEHADDTEHATSKAKKASNVKHFSGIITNLYRDYGLIDDETYFPLSAVRGKIVPTVGVRVHVEAHRKHENAGWRAVSVEPVGRDDWEEDPSQETCNQSKEVKIQKEDSEFDDSPYFDISSDDEMEKEQGGIGKITNYDQRTRTGHVDNLYNFTLNDVKQGFIPYRGDWVSATFLKKEEGLYSSDIKPLREMTFEGRVGSYSNLPNSRHGYINREIFFWPEAVVGNYVPRRGDFVSGRAIESNQKGDCKWRATVVEQSQRTDADQESACNPYFYRYGILITFSGFNDNIYLKYSLM